MAMTDGIAKLVKTGKLGNTDNTIKLYIYYKVVSQSTATKKTTLDVGMYAEITEGYPIGSWIDSGSYLKIRGTNKTFTANLPEDSTGTVWLVENQRFLVDHDSDGSGSATIEWKWGVNSSWGNMVYPSGLLNITLPKMDFTSSMSISGIREIGATVSISILRKSTDYTHTLQYYIHGKSGDYELIVNRSPDSLLYWKIPEEAYYYMTDKKATITVRCKTWNGNTLIGTTEETITVSSKKTSTISIAEARPGIGKTATIKINANSSSFKHILQWKLNTEADSEYRNITDQKISATNYKWIIPTEIYSYVSDIQTSKMITVKIITYYDDIEIGFDSDPCGVYCVEEDCKPILNPTLFDNSVYASTLTGDPDNAIIKGFNLMRYDIGAEPQHGAKITSQSVVCGDKSSTSKVGTLTWVDTNEFIFTAEDSRGFKSSITLTKPNFIEYFSPTCAADVKADLAEDNTVSLTITTSGHWFNGSFGAVDNNIKVEYKIGGGVETDWINVAVSKSGNTYTTSTSMRGLKSSNTYVVYVRAYDSVYTTAGNVNIGYVEAESKPISVKPIFNWGSDDFQFNVPVNVVDSLILNNDKAIYGRATDGTWLNALTAANGKNNLIIGWGSYDGEVGSTNLYGNNINIIAKDKIRVGSTLHLPQSQYYQTEDKSGGGLNAHNSDIIGVNALIFQDACNLDNNEGINFPNGSNWDVLKGNGGNLYYMPNYPDNTTASYNLTNNTVLWTGAYYMNDTQTVNLEATGKHISDQPHGIVLVWSYYSKGAVNSDFTYQFIPKYHVQMFNGTGVYTSNATCGMCKYVLVYDTKIQGHSLNQGSGTRNGLQYNNNSWVLRAVIGV